MVNMIWDELGITEEEIEQIANSMNGYFKEKTIRDFVLLCLMDLYEPLDC